MTPLLHKIVCCYAWRPISSPISRFAEITNGQKAVYKDHFDGSIAIPDPSVQHGLFKNLALQGIMTTGSDAFWIDEAFDLFQVAFWIVSH